MVEDLVKLMVEQWYLPEDQVREFLYSSLQADQGTLTLEQLREATSSLLQDTILNSMAENESPTLSE